MFTSNNKKSRRHKNPPQKEGKEEKGFFSKTKESASKESSQSPSQMPFFQAKLKMGTPGDKYEQEADRTADAVVKRSQRPSTEQQSSPNLQRVPLATPMEDEKLGTAESRMERDKYIQEKSELQRMEEEEAPQTKEEEETVQQQEEEEAPQTKEEEESVQQQEEEEAPQTKEEEESVQQQEEEEAPQTKEEEESVQQQEEEETPQTKEEEEAVQQSNHKKDKKPVASKELKEQLQHSAGQGHPLSPKCLEEMQAAFGKDFSEVRIHTGEDAIRMNKELNSQAFTKGRDIYFNEGKYNPDTADGKRLLAHELTHVVQQGAAKDLAKKNK